MRLNKVLGTFLSTYGGNKYKEVQPDELSSVLEGLIEILGLKGPDLVISGKLIRKIKKMKSSEAIVLEVSKVMFDLEGMGTE
jgi:CelD/BcsL family acetyltransferase involved in cellulose biosynthesis